jgi:cytochrome c biogenesis protein CcmG/thiol:disulfide interchange protein DsbE
MKNRALIPLIIFFSLAGLFYFMLQKINQGEYNPRHVPSTFIDKPAPAFSVPDLFNPEQQVTTDEMKGKVWLLNVWGTWCPECWREHEYLNHLAKEKGVHIVGVNWRDETVKAQEMLGRLGNPFVKVAEDKAGDIAIDWGVYGAPETFAIDPEGIIRVKHEGAMSAKVWKEKFEALFKQHGGVQ